MGTKRILRFTLVLGFILVLMSPAYEARIQQLAEELYESALFKKDVDGDLKGAIELFEKILAQFPKSRKIAAKAQLQIGICSEKLGLEEAKKAYQSVIAKFADQKDEVSEARSRLAALEKPATRPKTEGISIREVWTGSDVDIEGTPSPDGKYFSYTDWDTGDLGIRELAAGKKRRLTINNKGIDYDEMAWGSRWSPDGKFIAYDWGMPDTWDIRVIGIDGSPPLTLFQGNDKVRAVNTMGWSPDSTHVLAIIRNWDETKKIVLLSLIGESMKILKSFKSGRSFFMYFSPNGQNIIYDFPSKEGSRNRDIFIISLDGKLDNALIEHPADDYPLCWSKDGRQIYFVSTRAESHDLWSIGIENGIIHGEPLLIKSDVGEIIPMGTAKNGSLYFWKSKNIEDVYIAEINPETQTITEPAKKISEKYEGTTREADYSPDGKYLAYISRQDDSPESRYKIPKLIIRSLETGEERELRPNLRSILGTRWAPDSSTILASGESEVGRGIVQFNLENGDYETIMPLDKGFMYVYRPKWSNDGKSFYFVRNEFRSKKSTILKWDIASQTEKEILKFEKDERLISTAVSPNEKWIALVWMLDGMKIELMPISGVNPKTLYKSNSDEIIIGPLNWTPDGKHLIFARGNNRSKQNLWKISVDGGLPEKLGLEMKIGGRNLSIHPNGNQIVFSSSSLSIEISVMENFMQATETK